MKMLVNIKNCSDLFKNVRNFWDLQNPGCRNLTMRGRWRTRSTRCHRAAGDPSWHQSAACLNSARWLRLDHRKTCLGRTWDAPQWRSGPKVQQLAMTNDEGRRDLRSSRRTSLARNLSSLTTAAAANDGLGSYRHLVKKFLHNPINAEAASGFK